MTYDLPEYKGLELRTSKELIQHRLVEVGLVYVDETVREEEGEDEDRSQ